MLAAVVSVSEETFATVVQNSWCQMQLFLNASGTYTEYVFTWLSVFQDYWTDN
jgi:hypothetical protein